MANSNAFWTKPKTPHSKLKSEIVLKYFSTWSVVVGRSENKIGYLDLYAGKGENSHGELSTAAKIIQFSNDSNSINQKTLTLLNDVKPTYIKNLEKVISKNKFDSKLKYKPQFSNLRVDEQFADMLLQVKLIPSFCFIDPYGYKGLSQKLIYAVNKNKGCDTLLFFHTSGINRNILNDDSLEDMSMIFGDNYLKVLKRVQETGKNREDVIISEFEKSVRKNGVKYFIPFCINFNRSRGVSHHLIFMSKHQKGFEIMKTIMHPKSQHEDGIASYKYIEGFEEVGEQENLPFLGPMSDLKELLLKKFCNKKITVGSIFLDLNAAGYLYVERNVKDALKLLLKEEKIKPIYLEDRKPRKGTLPNWVIINFS